MKKRTGRKRALLLAAIAIAPATSGLTSGIAEGAPLPVPPPTHEARTPGSMDVPSTGSTRTEISFNERLAQARQAYFADLEGEHGADDQARQRFAALEAQRPHDPVIDAYLGSLQLLESARTLAVWRKHSLATDGLARLDAAVNQAPENLEARFVRALTTWHLPFFFHRKEQAEMDLGFLGPRAEQAAKTGTLPPPLAAAALDYWGQVLADRGGTSETKAAKDAFAAAVRVDPSSPAGQDARKRLDQ